MFITFEGVEGAGKSTLIQNIFQWLKTQKKDVLLTREPGGSKLGEEIRKLLLEKRDGLHISERAELFLFLAARIQHIEEVIRPALQAHKIVLCDRFADSTAAYQGSGRGLGVEYVEKCRLLATNNLQPDRTFYIDLDPEVGLKRAAKRQGLDRFEQEKIEFHTLVRKGFLELAKRHPERIIVLDGTKSESELFEEVKSFLK